MLAIMGAVFDVPNLINVGVLLFVLGLPLSVLWKIIENFMKDRQARKKTKI
ncbi:MAG TPA: hypothetical protein VF893_00790 [Candidatus Bathyarchaeia archaeon]